MRSMEIRIPVSGFFREHGELEPLALETARQRKGPSGADQDGRPPGSSPAEREEEAEIARPLPK